jgi:hypothetical protein
LNAGFAAALQAAGIAMFTGPGALIRGQIVPKIQAAGNPDEVKAAIAVLFIEVGALMLVRLIHYP